MAARQVRALLMGGQACVFYSAAEFSRDTDLAVLAELNNLARLRDALSDLRARCITVPPLEIAYLQRGHKGNGVSPEWRLLIALVDQRSGACHPDTNTQKAGMSR